MDTLTITLPVQNSSYPIHLAPNLLTKLPEIVDVSTYSQIGILTDDNLMQTQIPTQVQACIQTSLPQLNSHIFTVHAGESSKTIDSAMDLWEQLASVKFDRKSLLINVGGGMITDLGGLVASVYMRGIDFLNIPTTLLAMVDASVGGKTGINYQHTKNLIGTFTQPIAVIIDPQVLGTLSARELSSGWAEVIKHGLIADPEYYSTVTQKSPRDYTPQELTSIISKSNQIKADVVQQDPTEQGLRKILNFGHTIGHALESLSHDTDKPLLHGEAIGLGMLAESHLSLQLGTINEEVLHSIKQALQTANLPTTTSISNLQQITAKMTSDKKTTHGQINFSLLNRVGEASYNIQVSSSQVEKAIAYISQP